jgi:hypothetical protein
MEQRFTPEQIETNPEVNQELAARLIGGRAMEMYAVPIDPMDELQCDSCQ